MIVERVPPFQGSSGRDNACSSSRQVHPSDVNNTDPPPINNDDEFVNSRLPPSNNVVLGSLSPSIVLEDCHVSEDMYERPTFAHIPSGRPGIPKSCDPYVMNGICSFDGLLPRQWPVAPPVLSRSPRGVISKSSRSSPGFTFESDATLKRRRIQLQKANTHDKSCLLSHRFKNSPLPSTTSKSNTTSTSNQQLYRPFENMPVEVIENILSFLSLADKGRMKRLHRSFARLLSSPHLYRTITISGYPPAVHPHPQLVSLLPRLLPATQNLSLTSLPLLTLTPLLLSTSPVLTYLDLSFSGISDEVLEWMGASNKLRNVKHLRLKGCRAVRDMSKVAGYLESLLRLDLSWSGVEILPNMEDALLDSEELRFNEGTIASSWADNFLDARIFTMDEDRDKYYLSAGRRTSRDLLSASSNSGEASEGEADGDDDEYDDSLGSIGTAVTTPPSSPPAHDYSILSSFKLPQGVHPNDPLCSSYSYSSGHRKAKIRSPPPFSQLRHLSLSSCPMLSSVVIQSFLTHLPPSIVRLDLSHLGLDYACLSQLNLVHESQHSTNSSKRTWFSSGRSIVDYNSLEEVNLVGNDTLTKRLIHKLEKRWSRSSSLEADLGAEESRNGSHDGHLQHVALRKPVKIVHNAILESDEEEDVRRFVMLIAGAMLSDSAAGPI